MNKKQYRYEGSLPSIVVEIMLPKKAEHLISLYQILKRGFLFPKRTFYRDNKDAIIEFFAERFIEARDNYPWYLEHTERVYYGYSIYEVDGMFFSNKKDDAKELSEEEINKMTEDELYEAIQLRTYEERTSVVKLIFKPDISSAVELIPQIDDSQKKIINSVFSHFLNYYIPDNNERFTLKNTDEFSKNFPEISNRFVNTVRYWGGNNDLFSESTKRTIIDHAARYAYKWYNSVGFFLIGYLMYNIQQTPGINEEEIWFTVNFNSDVFVIKQW